MATHNVPKKIPVHLIFPSPTGKIKSEIPQEIPDELVSNQTGGIIKLDIACIKGTDRLPESATNVARCVTCVNCQKTPEYLKVLRSQSPKDEGVEAKVLSESDIQELLNPAPKPAK